jgi:hypothetical protein
MPVYAVFRAGAQDATQAEAVALIRDLAAAM